MIRLRLRTCSEKASDALVAYEIDSMRRCFGDMNINYLDKELKQVLSDLGIKRSETNSFDWVEKRVIEDNNSGERKLNVRLDVDIETFKTKPSDDFKSDSKLGLLNDHIGRECVDDGIQSLLTPLPKRLDRSDFLGSSVGGYRHSNGQSSRSHGSRKATENLWRGKNTNGNSGCYDEPRSIHKNIAKVTIPPIELEKMGIEGKKFDSGLDGGEETQVQTSGDVSIKLDRKTVQSQLMGIDLYATYSRQKVVNRSNGQVLTVPKEFKEAINKQDKWTYKLLAQNPTIDAMIEIIIENIRLLQIAHKAASNSNITVDIEWILLFDNSGSMVQIGNSCAEILAILAEVLRMLEFRFAVGTLGASARLIKTLDEPFTNMVGERILACFSYNERTNILSSTEGILEKVTLLNIFRIYNCMTFICIVFVGFPGGEKRQSEEGFSLCN